MGKLNPEGSTQDCKQRLKDAALGNCTQTQWSGWSTMWKYKEQEKSL